MRVQKTAIRLVSKVHGDVEFLTNFFESSSICLCSVLCGLQLPGNRILSC
ncbi:hypothetical protein ZEAMMB73_Zm00001d046397, partial [Zea mays]